MVTSPIGWLVAVLNQLSYFGINHQMEVTIFGMQRSDVETLYTGSVSNLSITESPPQGVTRFMVFAASAVSPC